MMKKNVIKIVSFLLMVSIFLMLLANSVFAFSFSASAKSLATATDASKASGSISTVVQAALTVARVAATGVAVVMLVVLAMKYMLAAPGDRADIKKHAVVYVVGAIILFSGAGLLKIIGNFANSAIQ